MVESSWLGHRIALRDNESIGNSQTKDCGLGNVDNLGCYFAKELSLKGEVSPNSDFASKTNALDIAQAYTRSHDYSLKNSMVISRSLVNYSADAENKNILRILAASDFQQITEATDPNLFP